MLGGKWPETAKFSIEDDHALLFYRFSTDTGSATMTRIDRRAAKCLGTVRYLGMVNTGYAGSFFISTIIKELVYTSSATQAEKEGVQTTCMVFGRGCRAHVAGCMLEVNVLWYQAKVRS
ncbi:hypothetical protein BU23DRAFT_662777 [Bimuria novae-zelandiae CBS 107.79]|uniref:Uncharacterized protein n=1 Tax=Bimuria novae-zelandiae CBS 107.79 TaxID=1447943 RepID=A0A6A5VL61_9PLEO|nr:hypothetical protein BU23DRAFT_662777 [Bimuria novae-zelandiae CBS 107.79]